MLKILLVAPTDPNKPSDLRLLVGGDNTFTKSLLDNPPKNVKYTYYDEALTNGEIEYTLLHSFLRILTKLRILPIGAGSQCFRIKGYFDLVHCHAYGIKIDRDIPVILSDSSSNYLFLRDYVNWPMWRIKLGLTIKKLLLKIFSVLDPDVNLRNSRLIVFSKFAFKIHQKLGIPSEKMKIIHPGLPKISHKKTDPVSSGEVNILFVGTWFERKGGLLLINAFKKLSKKYPSVKLTIVGEVPKKYKFFYSSSKGANATESRSKSRSSRLRSNNIYQIDYVSRDKLMKEFFPKADIFVLVPPKVEGFGFAVLEAMSFGIPVIVSRVCALPELVEDGKTGFVIKPNSLIDLTFNLERLIKDKVLREKMGKVARKRFEERFTLEKSNEKLLKVYRQALL